MPIYSVEQIPKAVKHIYDIFKLENEKESEWNELYKSYYKVSDKTDLNSNPFGDNQRAIIVTLAKTDFETENSTHQYILTTVRNKLAKYLPHHVLENCKI